MTKHVRTGIAFAFFLTSLGSAATLILNPRFVDHLTVGTVLFLVLPVVGGAFVGIVGGHQVLRLARVGSNEDIERAYELLWATLTGFLVFFGTLVFLPAFLGIFWPSETVRYGGAMIVAGGLCALGVVTIRHASHAFRPWMWALLLVLPTAVVVLGGTQWGRGTAPGSRVLVLAVPGLSWTVAEELIERGEMPHLEQLRRSGAWGDVHAPRPLLPPVVWTTVATGKTSEDHGVLSFSATSEDVRSRRIWEIFADRGWSVGLLGWPVTWPPRPVEGFVVPSHQDGGSETYPGELAFIPELAMREKTGRPRSWGRYCRFAFLGIRYGARLGTLIEAAGEILLDPLRGRDLDAARLFSKRKLRTKLYADYFVELRRRDPVDFAAYYTNIVHVAQSYFWKYHEPSAFSGISPDDISQYGESVHDAYRIVDDILGRVLAATSPNDLVVLVSDHGAEAAKDQSRPSLALRVEPALQQMRLKNAVEATNVGARTFIRPKPGHEGNQDRVLRLFETARLDGGDERIFDARIDDWGNVVVTVRQDARDRLSDVLLFQGGRCLAKDVVRTVEFQESARMKETGALVMAGSGVLPGRFDDASLIDLVPTLLVLNGLDLALDLPGEVIDGILPDSVHDRIPGFVATYDRPRQ